MSPGFPLKSRLKRKKTALIVGVPFVYMAMVLTLYVLFGHPLIKSMYEGRSIEVLNGVIEDRSEHPLEDYLKEADEVFYKRILFAPPGTFFFFFILYRFCRYLLRKEGTTPAKEAENHVRRDVLIAALAYSVCTVLFFYPCLTHISRSLLGPPEDNMHQLWSQWWVCKAVTEPKISVAFSNRIFYPEGSSLLYNDFGWYNYCLALAGKPFLNPVTIYNLIILHTYVIGGIGAFLLIRYLTGDSYASFIGGYIFAFNPSHFAHSLHHATYASIQFIPLFVLYFIKTLRSDSKKYLFAACLFFLLNTLCCWYYLVFAAYFMLFSYAYVIWKRKRILAPEVLAKIGAIIGVTLIVFSPWLFRMLVVGLQHPEVSMSGYRSNVTDLVALFVPHPEHLSGGIKILRSLNGRFTGYPWEKTVYLGIISILIVLCALQKAITKTAKYFLGFLAFLVLSMGVSMHVLGWVTPIMLPYQIIRFIPFLSNVRAPSRFIVYVYLFWAVIVSFALRYLFGLYKSERKKNYIATFFAFVLFLDYYSVCNVMTEVNLPPCYGAIEHKGDVPAILDLPAGYRENERYMMYQTYHGFPIVQGLISRKIGSSFADYLELEDLSRQEKQLRDNNVKFIVIHKKLISAGCPVSIKSYEERYDKVYEDGDNIVFQTY